MTNSKKLEKLLARMGGLYTVGDILERIGSGRMQSFTHGESWVVTQIGVFPQKRVLEIIAAVGDIDELRILHDKVLNFALEMEIPVIQAYGRLGWVPDALGRGWKVKADSVVLQRVF